MDDIAAEVRAAFAAIIDAIPPVPPEVSNAFFSHRSGRSPDPCGLHSEYVEKIIPRDRTANEAQSHRFKDKNTKATMNAAKMTMVPIPMGARFYLNLTPAQYGLASFLRK